MRSYSILISICLSFSLSAQLIPSSRKTDWSVAGIKDTTTLNFSTYDAHQIGLFSDGLTPNDSALNAFFLLHQNEAIRLYFPSGNYLFHQTINLPSNTIIKGDGAENTTFTIQHSNSGHGILIHGQATSDTTKLVQIGQFNDSLITVYNSSNFQPNDWIQLIQNDSQLITSSWAANSVGQIIQIESVNGNQIKLKSRLRLTYSLTANPFIKRILPATNVGIECLKIERIDNTAPEQASNVHFSYAVNSWVSGIESSNTTFAHIEAEYSSNLAMNRCYFHDAFGYGDGGRAYGIMLHFTTNECLIEDNVFKHLRHSMILQAGANCNVFAYNYSKEPYWTEVNPLLPSNSSGDMVLHGNYPYLNLFEQNIGQNIVIDNSHGANGPFNTFFRNRAESFGVFFSDATSPSQNIIATEIPNTGFPYSVVNYTISGTDHLLLGNNNKGTIVPSGTEDILENSLYYLQNPNFVQPAYFAGIGSPNSMNSNSNPAENRFNNNSIFSTSCGNTDLGLSEEEQTIKLSPNPFSSSLSIDSDSQMEKIEIFNCMGERIYSKSDNSVNESINTDDWQNGVYFIKILQTDGRSTSQKLIKMH